MGLTTEGKAAEDRKGFPTTCQWMMEWWQRAEGWQILANRKVPMALCPLHIAQEPLQDLVGAPNSLSSFGTCAM